MSDTKKTIKKTPITKKTPAKAVDKKIAPKTKKVAKKKAVKKDTLTSSAQAIKKEGNFAVIQTGGKQYLVRVGDVLKIEKLKGKEGDNISFDKVLLTTSGKDVKIGAPYLVGAKVEARILEQGRAKKITVLRYKPKIRYKKKKGHRQPFTMVEITKI